MSGSYELVLLGNGPKDKRETPDVLSLGTWFPVRLFVGWLGVSSTTEDADDPTARFRLRTVTEEGIPLPITERGDALGGVVVGAGNLERAF